MEVWLPFSAYNPSDHTPQTYNSQTHSHKASAGIEPPPGRICKLHTERTCANHHITMLSTKFKMAYFMFSVLSVLGHGHRTFWFCVSHCNTYSMCTKFPTCRGNLGLLFGWRQWAILPHPWQKHIKYIHLQHCWILSIFLCFLNMLKPSQKQLIWWKNGVFSLVDAQALRK